MVTMGWACADIVIAGTHRHSDHRFQPYLTEGKGSDISLCVRLSFDGFLMSVLVLYAGSAQHCGEANG